MLIAANAVPVLGVWFQGWSAAGAFTVYAMETLILGILTVIKMIIISIASPRHEWKSEGKTTMRTGLPFILFFIAHFGIFALVQTTIFAQSAGITPPGKGMTHFFFHWYEYITPEIAWMLGGFVLYYIGRNLIPFLVHGDYKKASMMVVMFQPYGRIFIQQFTVILGSMFLELGVGKFFILVFAAARTFFELYFNFDSMIGQAMEKNRNDSAPKN